MPSTAPQTIAEQNDRFRKVIFYRPQRNGRLVLTQGVASLPDENLKEVVRAIIGYDSFDEGNDPYREHDFGSVEIGTAPKCFFKIDYYASPACEYGAPDPAAPSTYRIMTVMLAVEY